MLRADVDGQILMRAYLSGTPECKFGLNDKLVLDKSFVPSPPPFDENPNIAPHSDKSKSAGAIESSSVELDDCQFHQCVKLGKFDSDRTISFIPPDGEFELMRSVSPTRVHRSCTDEWSRYRSTTNINLPFKINPIVEERGSARVDYTVHVKANFSPKLNASNVIIRIPTPLNTTSVDCKVGMGKAKYVPAENVIIWK